jgi:hypothetical protein
MATIIITAAAALFALVVLILLSVKEPPSLAYASSSSSSSTSSSDWWCWPNNNTSLNESNCFPHCPPDQPQTFATASTLRGLKLSYRSSSSSKQDDCHQAFNYVTEARIYPEDLNVAVLTKRGWVNHRQNTTTTGSASITTTTTSRRGGAGAGVTLLNISNPSRPTVILVWDSPNNDAVEGQDRINDLLVVCSIDRGGIYTFKLLNSNSSSSSSSLSSLELLSYTDIPDAGSTLHVKLKQYNNNENSSNNSSLSFSRSRSRTVAFLSQGWCFNVELMKCDRFGWTKIHMVDVTNATHPTVLGSISTSVLQPESLQVRGNYLYVGGIGSNVLAVLNITNPDAVQVLCNSGICSSQPYYNQMVGEVLHDGVDGSFHPSQEEDNGNLLHRYWLAALWGTPGGLAVFDTRNPAMPVPVQYVTDKTLSSANRVHVHNHYAIIPMEQDPAGGFAVLNVANTSCPPTVVGIHFLGVGERHTEATTNGAVDDGDAPTTTTPVSSRVYCLVAKDDHVILFAAWTCEMYSFEIPMIASHAPVLECPPPPENEANRRHVATPTDLASRARSPQLLQKL